MADRMRVQRGRRGFRVSWRGQEQETQEGVPEYGLAEAVEDVVRAVMADEERETRPAGKGAVRGVMIFGRRRG